MNSIRRLCFLLLFVSSLSAQEGIFVLLTGPSGVGKTTLIKELQKKDSRFIYISPYTTRPLRIGETDKIYIDKKDLFTLNNSGKILKINHIYDVYYATPKEPIDQAIQQQKIPILDWPIDEIQTMLKAYPGKIFTVYLYVNSINELVLRLNKDERDLEGKRLQAGTNELKKYYNGLLDQNIDFHLENTKEKQQENANSLYKAILNRLS